MNPTAVRPSGLLKCWQYVRSRIWGARDRSVSACCPSGSVEGRILLLPRARVWIEH